MNNSLHPNLAKLAATYDEIFLRWSRGQIDADIARQEISALVARDDDGILWSIDPDSGAWLRRTISGELVPGTPPSYGLATPTPHDLSHNPGSFNPGNSVRMQKVDDELLYAPSSLAGSTRRGNKQIQQPVEKKNSVIQILIIAAGVGAILLFLLT
jgi:hypothetical protein